MAKEFKNISKAVANAVAEPSESTPLQTSTVSDTRTEAEWAIDIEKKIEEARADEDVGARSWPKVSIYRIPERLRNSDENAEKAYTPQTVSLGPYHHGEPRLSSMERHKWRAVHKVLKRTGGRIERYLAAVKEMEEDARARYEGLLEMSSEEFFEMLLVDSTFILEMFRGACRGFESLRYTRGDPVFARRAGMSSIVRDMILLENQIPLFVLDRIHAIQDGDGDVASLALGFFKSLVPTDKAVTSSDAALDYLKEQDGLHCLEVFRCSLLAVREEPEPEPTIKKRFHPMGRSRLRTGRVADKSRQPMIHCVTELKEAGVKFKTKETNKICDMEFNNGVLEIPRLLVHDGTKSLLLNLIAFEQCHLDSTDDITSYMVFMDNLINSPADVAYLHHYHIVDNYLGSNVEVSDLFNCLGHEC